MHAELADLLKEFPVVRTAFLEFVIFEKKSEVSTFSIDEREEHLMLLALLWRRIGL